MKGMKDMKKISFGNEDLQEKFFMSFTSFMNFMSFF